MTYRPEIDGLRAISIAVVVLYHGGFKFSSGGFIGVDVFFVISGFLITTIIQREIKEKRFSLLNFYEKRCRRILPPLLVMVFVVTLVSFKALPPPEYQEHGAAIFAMLIFVSNIFFYNNIGYWSPAADTMPLIHTWSLAVEEQFYLVFPLLLLILAKVSAHSTQAGVAKIRSQLSPLILLILAIMSLWLGVAGIKENPSAVFYLPQYRAWELLLGGLLVFMPRQLTLKPRPFTTSILGLVGISCIILPAIFYTSSTVFPAMAAIPPCLGAAIIIYIHSSGVESGLVGRFLSLPPMIGLGKISYSLYLWHWPVFVLYSFITLDSFVPAEKPISSLCLIFVSIWFSIISYYFIEQPVRRRQILSSRIKLFATSATCLLILLVFGAIIKHYGGLPFRVPPRVSLYAESLKPPTTSELQRTSYYSSQIAHKAHPYTQDAKPQDALILGARTQKKELDFLIWGDSHAYRWGYAVAELAEQYNQTGINGALGNILPFLDFEGLIFHSPGAPQTKRIQLYNHEILDIIKHYKIKHVIIASRFFSGCP